MVCYIPDHICLIYVKVVALTYFLEVLNADWQKSACFHELFFLLLAKVLKIFCIAKFPMGYFADFVMAKLLGHFVACYGNI